MKSAGQKHYTDTVMTLIAFGLFAACIIAVLLAGAGVYNRIVAADTDAFNARTGCRYIATRVRSAAAEKVSACDTEAGSTLCISEEINGRSYVTYIYCCDGWLMELFAPADADFLPEAGEKLLPAGNAGFECSGRIVSIELADDEGAAQKLRLCLREGGSGI